MPVDDAALLRQAFALHQQGQWEAAQHGYAQLVQRHPDHVNAWQLWGVMLHQWGRHAEAVERLTRAIALRPRQADFYANRGWRSMRWVVTRKPWRTTPRP